MYIKIRSFIKVKDDIITEYHFEHDNDPITPSILQRHIIFNSLKRKSLEYLHEKPGTILCKDIDKNNSSFSTVDVSLIRKNMYNARRSALPDVPTSILIIISILNFFMRELPTNYYRRNIVMINIVGI